MSLAEIKEKAAALPTGEQAELLSFLSERFRNQNPAYQQEMAKLIDDKNPANWVKIVRPKDSVNVVVDPLTRRFLRVNVFLSRIA